MEAIRESTLTPKRKSLIKRLIYISSTGVYPIKSGLWREDSVFIPESIVAKKRLLSEKILSNYFELQVIRPGGIYGLSLIHI